MTQQINLYNPLLEEKERQWGARTMAQALGVVALALMCSYIYAALQAMSAERTAAQVGAEVKQQREQVTNLAAAAQPKPSKALEAEVTRLQDEINARQASLQALEAGELGNSTGFSEYFAAFGRQVVPGVWLTAITISDAGNQIQIQGRALRPQLVSTFLSALGNESVMQGRNVTDMKVTAYAAPAGASAAPANGQPKSFVEFSVSAPLMLVDEVATKAKGTQ